MKRIVLSAGSNWLAFAAAVAVSFVLTPVLLHGLGPGRYDVWCVAEAVLAYFTLLEGGVGPGLMRAVAARRDVNAAAAAAFSAYSLAGVVAVAIGTPIMLILAPALEARGGADVTPFLLLLTLNLALTLPLGVFPTVLEGLDRYPARSAVRIAFLVLRSLALFIAVSNFDGLLPLAVVFLATTLFENAVMYGLCRTYLPGFAVNPFAVPRAEIVRTWSTGRDAFLAMLAGRLAGQTGAVVVGLMLPAGSVTAFATALRLIDYARTALRTVTATLTPGIAKLDAAGDRDGIRRVFLTATRWVLYLGLPVQLGVLFFGEPFLVRWLGSEVGTAAAVPMTILAATIGATVAQSAASRVLYGLGELRRFARFAVCEGIATVALTFAIAGPLGLSGAAIAATVPHLLFCAAVILHAARVLGVTRTEYIATVTKPLLAVLVPTAIWFALGTPAADYAAISLSVAAGLVPFAAVVAGMEFAPRLRLTPRPRALPVSTR